MKLKKIYVKLTDNYIYVYSNKVLKKYESKYIKNGKVDNPYKLINYLNRLLNNNIFKKKYIFILEKNHDTHMIQTHTKHTIK